MKKQHFSLYMYNHLNGDSEPCQEYTTFPMHEVVYTYNIYHAITFWVCDRNTGR